MSIQHIDDNQKVFGPDPSANPVRYFINPSGIQSIVLSALELGGSTNISMDSLTTFSANVNLLSGADSSIAITFPLVQGMSFVTGIFKGSTPILQTGVLFRSIVKEPINPKPNVTKYTIILNDGKTWLLYAYSPTGSPLLLTLVNNGLAQATSSFNGIIQIAKDPGNGQALYDAACGAYPTSATLSGGVSDTTGSYTLAFSKEGLNDTDLVMFALPHLVESFSPQTMAQITDLKLDTTTKGQATAVKADSWTMVENLPTTLGFAPWSPSTGTTGSFSAGTIAAIHSIAANEVSENMASQTDLNSMYFSGKVSVFQI
jgi:endo-1,3(4)-beta-glucanase